MRRTLRRKIALMVAILICFIASWPARMGMEYFRSEEYRKDHPDVHLSRATLGDVDPTNVAILLVLGGLRGVAANWLWVRAEELQKNHRWAELAVEVDRIIKLQPHFVAVWRFQSWNLAYNVSAEWDQINDKYYWIREGIRFSQRGTRINQHEESLLWWTGWCYFHKIGKADEAKLLRALFKHDTEPQIDARGRRQPAFNPQELDNFEAAEEWFTYAVDKIEQLDRPPRQMAEPAFRSYPGHSRIQYAIALESEGTFGDLAARNWARALERWVQFGGRDYSVQDGRLFVKLEYRPEIEDAWRAAQQAHELAYALKQQLDRAGLPKTDQDRRQTLEQLQLVLSSIDTAIRRTDPVVLRELLPGATEAFRQLGELYSTGTRVDPRTFLDQSSEGVASRQAFNRLYELFHNYYRYIDEERYWQNRYGDLVNYRYWKSRCLIEMEPETLRAREHFYAAQQAFEAADLETAQRQYEEGLLLWARILHLHPEFAEDDQTAEETHALIMGPLGYQRLLRSLDEEGNPDEHPVMAPFFDLVDKFVPPPQYEKAMELYGKMQRSGISQEERRRLGEEAQRLLAEGEQLKAERKRRSRELRRIVYEQGRFVDPAKVLDPPAGKHQD
jgi:hypothetical protein